MVDDAADDPLQIASLVTETLDRLHVPYHLCGSIVSSMLGDPRLTNDIDLVADLGEAQVPAFVSALKEQFYVDADGVLDAVRRRSSFNLIHLAGCFKIDVFLLKDRPFCHEEMRRRTIRVIADEPVRHAAFATAEDTILAKLEWFEAGDRASDRQWRDVLGVLKTQHDRLDLPYLRHWADELRVRPLLDKALGEAGI